MGYKLGIGRTFIQVLYPHIWNAEFDWILRREKLMNKYESVGRGGRGRFLIIWGGKLKKLTTKGKFLYTLGHV